uniref:Uncharacterized protein n=1 Tax=Rhipicephalus zambeziensis TaxID=60191 RepID=A0A224YF49_9ACAR
MGVLCVYRGLKMDFTSFLVIRIFLLPLVVRITDILVFFVKAIVCHSTLFWAGPLLPSKRGHEPCLGLVEKHPAESRHCYEQLSQILHSCVARRV